jgi:predicted nucleotidyltransferase
MVKRNEVLERLGREKPRLEEQYQLKRLAIFGSVARDEQAEESDIDILVDVPGSIGLRFVDLADDLERVLDHKVDLVSQQGLKATLKQAIEADLIDA